MSLLPDDVTKRLAGQLTGSGAEVEVIAPFTGEPLVALPTSAPSDVVAAYARARSAQATWAATPVGERAATFVRFHDLVLNDSSVIDVIQAETGKARYSAFEETVDVANVSLYYGRRAARFLRPRRRGGAIPLATRTRELRHPKGTVALISPFNYPLSLAVGDAIPALVAGNAIVHKPDTQTTLTSLRARELLVDAGLPADVWQVVVGDPAEIGTPLIEGADHVVFTGSTTAGRRVAGAAAERLIGATLELGGKNPMIVFEDADLEKAARGAVRACFTTTGQLCLSIERIYVHDDVFEPFLRKLVERTRQLRLGSTFDFDCDVGSLSSQRQLDVVARHVSEAVAAGARVEVGGRARPDLGPCFYEPTVLTGVTPSMAVFSEETFGPVASVYRFATDEEAVTCANATEYGLNASLWTRDVRRARRLSAQIQAGMVNINEGIAAAHGSVDAPTGGMKSSGIGRRHGEHGLLEHCELQTVASQHGIGFDPPPGLSLAGQARMLTTVFKLMKGLRLR